MTRGNRFTGIDYESFGAWTGRLRMRLEANYHDE